MSCLVSDVEAKIVVTSCMHKIARIVFLLQFEKLLLSLGTPIFVRLCVQTTVEMSNELKCDSRSWLRNYPSSFHGALQHDAAASLASLHTFLPLSLAFHDIERAGRIYMRRLEAYLDSKYPLTAKDRARLLQVVLELILAPGVNHYLLTRWCAVATRLAKSKYTPEIQELVSVPWQPWYRLLTSLLLPLEEVSSSGLSSEAAVTYPGREDADKAANNVAKLVKRLRSFFPPGAATQVWQQLKSDFAPFHSSSIHRPVVRAPPRCAVSSIILHHSARATALHQPTILFFVGVWAGV